MFGHCNSRVVVLVFYKAGSENGSLGVKSRIIAVVRKSPSGRNWVTIYENVGCLFRGLTNEDHFVQSGDKVIESVQHLLRLSRAVFTGRVLNATD